MHQNAGRAELRNDLMRQIAGAFRGAGRQHHHVALRKRLAHGFVERRRIVGDGAEGNRLAAGFGNGGGDDRAVAVVDAGGL